jgi:hypothetical protein
MEAPTDSVLPLDEPNVESVQQSGTFEIGITETIERIIFKLVLVFVTSFIIFYIFTPYFYRTRRRRIKPNDFLFILYSSLLSTIAFIILSIVYLLFKKQIDALLK